MIKVAALMFVAVIASQAFAISDKAKAEIAERIKPVGQVCVEGEAGCAAAAAVNTGEPRSGEEIVNASCNACHATGAAGAPKVGDKAAWANRIAAGIDTVYANAINGLNGMPAKGLCMDCSEDEVKAAVDFMVKKSK